MTQQTDFPTSGTASDLGAGAPGFLGGTYRTEKGRVVWVPQGMSGREIAALTDIICEQGEVDRVVARPLAISLLGELARLRSD